MPEDVKPIADTLRLLSSETRLQILCALIEHPYGVNALCEALPVTQSAVSQNLARLKDCGMVADRRTGQKRRTRLPTRVCGR